MLTFIYCELQNIANLLKEIRDLLKRGADNGND